jgi:hypothetical protein
LHLPVRVLPPVHLEEAAGKVFWVAAAADTVAAGSSDHAGAKRAVAHLDHHAATVVCGSGSLAWPHP